MLSALAEEVGARQTLPIDPLAIIRARGITDSFGEYGDAFDGLLEWRSEGFHVFCNLARVGHPDSPRARFTLGHELGHYFIDEHRNALVAGVAPAHPSFCDYQSSRLVEVEADCFASALLMPWTRFRGSVRKSGKQGLAAIVDLADEYQTSITATALRYLRYEDASPCIVVKWNRDGYAWKRLSTEAYAQGFRSTVDDVRQLPHNCPTARALAGKSEGVVEAGTTAAHWFPAVKHGAQANAIFIEQAISLGRFGALTFLFPTR